LDFHEYDRDQIHRLELLRKERQRLFGAGRLQLHVFVDESVLRRPSVANDVMVEQLRHLLEMSHAPNVRLRVLPFSGRGYFPVSGFSILEFADDDMPDVVYSEQLTSALYLDKPADVSRYMDLMNRLAAMSMSVRESRELISQLLAGDVSDR
jgi:uncharacterized protein DUF5753